MQLKISCMNILLLLLGAAVLITLQVVGIEAIDKTILSIVFLTGAIVGLYFLVNKPIVFLTMYYSCMLLIRGFAYTRFGPVYITEVVIVLLMMRLILVHKLGSTMGRIKSNKLLFVSMLGFLFMGLLSLVRGYQNGMLAPRDSVIIFYSITILIVVGLFSTEKDIHQFLKLLIVVGILYNGLLIIKLFTEGFTYSEMATPRLFGARSSAFLFLIGSLAVSGSFGKKSRTIRNLRYFGIWQFIIIILLSGTRNVWIASVASFIFWNLFLRRRAISARAILVYTLAVTIFVIGIFVLSKEQYTEESISGSYERALNSILDYQQSSNAMSRMEWWKEAIDVTVNENLLLGKPFGSMTLFMKYTRQYDTEMRMAFHNSYITVLYFTGFLGLLFLMMLVYWLLRIGWIFSTKSNNRDIRCTASALTIAFFFYCIVSFFNVILEGPQSAMMYWLIAGLILALGRIQSEMTTIPEADKAVSPGRNMATV